jgi:lysozyme family protein
MVSVYFVFVELKANINDLKKATKQIINTYQAFKKHLNLQNVYKFKAFICAYRGSVPQEHQQCNHELAKVFQTDNFKSNGKGQEFGDFLREKQPKRQRKKGRK